MKKFLFLMLLLVKTNVLILKRLLRGPARPSWAFSTEWVAMATRTACLKTRKWGVVWLRQLLSQRDQALIGSRREKVLDFEVEWFGAEDRTTQKHIIYLHGGGYAFGSSSVYSLFLRELSKTTQRKVLGVNYRLAPEHPFPIPQQDCLAAYHWLREQGVQSQDIVLAGDSAGAALCLATMLELRQHKQEQPAAAVLISPWVDPTASGGSVETNRGIDVGDRDYLMACIRQLAKPEEFADPRVTPLGADLTGLPPMLVLVGQCELLLDQVRAFAEKAKAAGVEVQLREYPDMFHGFFNYLLNLEQAKNAFRDICEYIEE